jgi:hypothetical protein
VDVVTLVGVGRHKKTLGVVVDLCPLCACLQPHWLCENYAALEVHHVKVDSGVYADTSSVCFRCSREVEVARSSYRAILPQEVARNTHLDEGLELTNPVLAEALRAIVTAGASDAPRELLERAESILYTRRSLGEQVDALHDWSNLGSTERERVATRIEEQWRSLRCPRRPTVPIQPGMPGWLTPTQAPSVWRAIDRRSLVIIIVVVGSIVGITIVLSILLD